MVDYYGRIIDGNHRSGTNKNWRKEKLNHIKTEEDLLIARLACNTVRRTVTSREKTNTLANLAEIYLAKGIPIGKLSYELMDKTGMSYRWIAKYLPKKYKQNKNTTILTLNKEKKGNVIKYKTKSFPLKESPEDALKIKLFSNTNFRSLIIADNLYVAIEKKANELDISVTKLLYNAISNFLSTKMS